MKFTISQKNLGNVLKNVSSSMNSKSPMQVLRCVKIDAKSSGSIVCTTTNLETETRSEIDAVSVVSEGSVAVQMEILSKIVDVIDTDKDIDVYLDNDSENAKLILESDGDRFDLLVSPTDEFPDVFKDELKNEISLDSKALTSLINRVEFSVSHSPDRYNLNGLYIATKEENGSNYIIAVSTDGHRLSFAKSKINDGITIDGVIIPRKATSEIKKLVSGKSGDCKLYFSDSKSIVKVESTEFSTKLLDAKFPNYTAVIPEGNDKILEVNAKDLLKKLKRSSVIVNDKGLRISISSDKIKFASAADSGDSSSVEMSCVFSETEEFKTKYNSQFLIDAVSHADVKSDSSEKDKDSNDNNLKITFNQKDTPLLINFIGNDDFFYVIMPMKGDDV